ncbi:MAG: Glu/Leu/Phe/Val dehydrogenase dimerization domain-containing protein [Acidobacteriaceae bacterium]
MNSALVPPDLDEISDPLLQATSDLENCARVLDLEDWVLLRLRQFEQETSLHTSFPTADRHVHPLTALWVRHSTVRGAPIVPLVVSGDAFLNSVLAKAMRMTWISALYGLETGGGAAAIILDPRQYGEDDLRVAISRVGQSMAPFCAPHLSQSAEAGLSPVVIPEGMNSIEMEWFNASFRGSGNTFTRIAGRLYGPPYLPESDDVGSVENAAAFCLAQLIRCAAGHVTNLRVAIQGFDPVCQNLAHRLQRCGARVVAIADASGGVCDPLGLDPTALIAYIRENEMLVGYPSAEAIVNADLLESACDVLVLANGERQVTAQNAAKIHAGVVLEAASRAISSTAREELSAAGKAIVSNLICGGVRPLYYATESERATLGARTDPWMRRRMHRAWKDIQSAAAKWKVTLSHAAELLAIERVSEVIRARGR